MRILSFLYRLPVLPILVGYDLYAIKKIVEESDITDLASVDEKELQKILEPHRKKFEETYAGPLHLFSILSWLTFIRIVILNH